MKTNLRLTTELLTLIRHTAMHCGITETDVLRASANGFFHGRKVVQKRLSEVYHRSGPEMVGCRFRIPEDKDAFRRVIALRCMEELAKPKYEPFIPPEGVQYVLVQEPEE